ncbi:hypothetical protein [Barrientosiimonas endolithica]|uniref:hypothetical protein n=1 Tax=Barrientosiimonas endolithica TaxID=1535208 RepID=UPI0033062891
MSTSASASVSAFSAASRSGRMPCSRTSLVTSSWSAISSEAVAAAPRNRDDTWSSPPDRASSRLASARRTSWASSADTVPSTRPCNRSSRAAV